MNINWRIIIPIVLLLIYAFELANKLMKMNMEKAIMVMVSLLLYISACCANVFAGGERNPGWAYLLGGWIEIFLVKWSSKLFYRHGWLISLMDFLLICTCRGRTLHYYMYLLQSAYYWLCFRCFLIIRHSQTRNGALKALLEFFICQQVIIFGQVAF